VAKCDGVEIVRGNTVHKEIEGRLDLLIRRTIRIGAAAIGNE